MSRISPDFVPKEVIDPEPDVTLGEFFDPKFMARHTEFPTFEAFCEHSPWAIENRSDLDRIPRDRLDTYVERTTAFETWREMRNRAASREIRERLLV